VLRYRRRVVDRGSLDLPDSTPENNCISAGQPASGVDLIILYQLGATDFWVVAPWTHGRQALAPSIEILFKPVQEAKQDCQVSGILLEADDFAENDKTLAVGFRD
jgi:hypothetical protein